MSPTIFGSSAKTPQITEAATPAAPTHPPSVVKDFAENNSDGTREPLSLSGIFHSSGSKQVLQHAFSRDWAALVFGPTFHCRRTRDSVAILDRFGKPTF